MASSPDNRVRHLLGLPLDTRGGYSYRKPVTQTPTTISGGRDMLFSYRMPIMWRQQNGDYLVTNERNSPTTNRHIAAVHAVMQDECQEIGTESFTELRRRPYSGFADETVTVTRYRPKYGSRLASEDTRS